MRGRAWQKFFEGLERGDPVAYGLLGFVVFLMVVAGAIWLVDFRKQQREKSGAKGGRRIR